jgi:hypothetical protein
MIQSKENIEPQTISRICQILDVKDVSKLVPCVQKLNTVLRCVPKMEHLIREVGHIVFPELQNSSDREACSKKMQILVPTLSLLY